ncbi:N-6 DNA methylase [bacterium]|nr:N-6 DNA methylase [bacterium]
MTELTRDSLKKLWNKEKDSYRSIEIGSGVQKFVKNVLKCSELFNFKEGKLSTKDLQRKNEFLEETTKKTRRADVVIFIDGDIIIPIEVEKYGNIEAGEKQLRNYQADWIKKYGILTDGDKWRFYNNTLIEKTFLIDDILNDPTDFLTFWKEYTTPEYYYRSFFEKKGQKPLFDEHIPHLDEVREDFFKDITKLIENFKNKLNLKGYFEDVKDKNEREKKAVEITYAYLIQFILYKTLVDNSFADFENDWQDRINSVYKALKGEAYSGIISLIRGISNKISNNIYKRFSDEQEIINNHLEGILDKPKNEIGDVSVWLDILLFINRYDFCNVENEIFGYVYENYLKDLDPKNKKKGQYFTDPHVVDFMLDQMGYKPSELKKRYEKEKDSISIIDPSCGSGTFLYNATNRLVETFFEGNETTALLAEKLINDNIFGLDIAEFPLYLAEMNILMQMLPLVINEQYANPVEQKLKAFKTRDSISEFLDTAIRNTLTDALTEKKRNNNQISFLTDALDLGYNSHMRDKSDLKDLKNSLENRNGIPRFRFDYVIGNPPYVSYNECAKQHLLIINLIKEGKVGMNDLYGLNLNSIPGKLKSYPPKPNLYAFFIALGLGLLKDNGKLCYIIPQTLLTANDLDVVRHFLSNYYTIEKMITFSGKMFIGRGIKQNKPIATSSLIIVISKKPPTRLHKIEIINENHIDNIEDISQILRFIMKRKQKNRKFILQNKLLQNTDNWNFINRSKAIIEFIDSYKANTESFDVYRLFEYAEPRYKARFYFDVGFILNKKHYQNRPSDDCYEILDFKNFNGFSSFQPKQFYPKNNKLIKLTRSNQGYITLDQKWSIVWRIKNHNGFKLTDRPIIFHMGTSSIITSNNEDEMHYLLSLFNSGVSKLILESFLRIPMEKEYQVAILPVKHYIRVPKINVINQNTKLEIIRQTKFLLQSEKVVLQDYVDIKGLLLQKFDSVEVKGSELVICYKNNYVNCNIKDKAKLIQQTLIEQLTSLLDETGTGSISELKKLPVIDFERQRQIKDYVDDLVFSLYFKVKLSEIGFSNCAKVREACAKHKYYKL